MDLMEFHFWLAKRMRDKGIPGNARLKFADVKHPRPENIKIEYDQTENTVTITGGEAGNGHSA